MANTANIQILRSYVNDAPSTLLDGQLAYSYTSNTLFIGTQDSQIISIGGSHAYDGALIANNFIQNGGQVNGSVYITNDTVVGGNLNVLGAFTTINTASILVNDPLIEVGANNHTDTQDIGFVGQYNNGQQVITGLFRDYNSKEYYLFKDYSGPYGVGTSINLNDSSFKTFSIISLVYCKSSI